MNVIAARLRRVRHKLARLVLGLTTADQRIHHHYKREREARVNAQKLRRQGKISLSTRRTSESTSIDTQLTGGNAVRRGCAISTSTYRTCAMKTCTVSTSG